MLNVWFINRADQEKMMNATYIISIARKLGCSIFLLPEDITEVVGINTIALLPSHLFSTFILRFIVIDFKHLTNIHLLLHC